jgi:hypothetical protein
MGLSNRSATRRTTGAVDESHRTTRASLWPITYSASSASSLLLTGTAVAPALTTPNQATGKNSEFLSISATRPPGSTSREPTTERIRATRSPRSSYVIEAPSPNDRASCRPCTRAWRSTRAPSG